MKWNRVHILSVTSSRSSLILSVTIMLNPDGLIHTLISEKAETKA